MIFEKFATIEHSHGHIAYITDILRTYSHILQHHIEQKLSEKPTYLLSIVKTQSEK